MIDPGKNTSNPELKVLMLKTRLQAMDDTRTLAESLAMRRGTTYTDEDHDKRRQPVLNEIARLKSLPGYEEDGYP